jgi:kynurenine formamidase
MRLVDLSAPIANDPPEIPQPFRTELQSLGHEAGAAQIESMFGVRREWLCDGEGWAVEEFSRLGTHNSTHVDAPWHYNSTVEGGRAKTIEELPLEWFHQPGVVLDFTHKADGDGVTAAKLEAELARIRHTLAPLEIVLVRTGRDASYGTVEYLHQGPGVTAEATRWLHARGIRVMGIDAWGWDRPLVTQADGPGASSVPASSGSRTRLTSSTRRSSASSTSTSSRRSASPCRASRCGSSAAAPPLPGSSRTCPDPTRCPDSTITASPLTPRRAATGYERRAARRSA